MMFFLLSSFNIIGLTQFLIVDSPNSHLRYDMNILQLCSMHITNSTNHYMAPEITLVSMLLHEAH
jgi:hypothetical protein